MTNNDERDDPACAAFPSGGESTPRMEAFIAGRPVQELGEAMQLAEDSELVAAGSAVAALPSAWASAESRGGACACISLPKMSAGDSSKLLHGEGSNRSFGEHHGDVTVHEETAAVMEYAAKMQREVPDTKFSQSGTSSTRSYDFRSHVSSLSRSYDDMCCDADPSGSSIDAQNPPRAHNKTHGLDNLMLFMPGIVRKRCVEGVSLDMLAENRRVSIMFMVADFRV